MTIHIHMEHAIQTWKSIHYDHDQLDMHGSELVRGHESWCSSVRK